jgi:hypothetical protein
MALLYYHLTIISSFVLWGCQILYNINKLIKQYEYQERKELVNMDIILKSILRPPNTISDRRYYNRYNYDYYYGFPFTIIVNSIIWYGIFTLLTNIIGKTKGLTTRNILFSMHYQRLMQGKGKVPNNI